ncbi:MAG: hypothetical protein JXQ83_13010 [Candidatus Glassbacteria bacterium]|nr:hypothetical protein [Candidatus Glassbacteria bacterium]
MTTPPYLRVLPVLCSLLLAVPAGAPAQYPGTSGEASFRLHRDFLNRLNLEIDKAIGSFKHEPYRETTPLEPLEPRWKELGFIPFSRAYGVSVYPATVPGMDERGALLAGFAAPGEDEPLVFGVRTLDNRIERLIIEVGDLVCMDTTGSIPAADLELGVVEYFRVRWGSGSSARGWRYHPTRIWPVQHYPGSPFCGPAGDGALWVSASTAQPFWLTVHVPRDSPAGLYAGTIRLSSYRGSYNIPLYFTVLPVPLAGQGSPVHGVLMPGPLDRTACRDLAAHGVNAAGQWYDPRQMPLNFEHGRAGFDFGLQDAFIQRLAAEGIRGPHIIFAGGAGDAALDRTLKQAAGLEPDDPAYLPVYVQAVQSIFSHGRRAGWNRLYWGILDRTTPDSSSLAWFTVRAAAMNKLAGSSVPLVSPLCRGEKGEIDALAPYVDVWLAGEELDEMIFEARAQSQKNSRTWGYAGCTQRSTAAESRYRVGFGPWYRALDVVYVWAYNWIGGGHSWNDFDAPVMDWMLSYRDLEDRYLPTPAWEGFREGVDDRRYILTLERLLAGFDDNDPLAREGRLALSQLRPLMSGADAGPLDVALPQEAPLSTDKTTPGRARAVIAGHVIRLARRLLR